MVTLTPGARQVLLEHARRGGAEGYGLKIQVVAGGCAGFSYDLRLVPGPAAGDHVFGGPEMPVFVDPTSLRFLEGTEIDHGGRGFHFKNPRARGDCACGASFAL